MLLREILAYHGTDTKPKGKLKAPLFVTTAREGAEYFAHNRGSDEGFIIVGDVNSTKILDAFNDDEPMLEIAHAVGISTEDPDEPDMFYCPDIGGAGYDPHNISDLVYLPKFAKELKKRGYDTIRVNDVLTNDQIETFILMDTSKFEIKSVDLAPKEDSEW